MNTKKSFRELPEVSVIIPVYRVEDYINQCVDSVLSQTFKNIEIILVDDGSIDNCGAICDQYIRLDKRIKVIHKSNGGLSDARNAGLEFATGEYIYFFDGDDWIDSDLLECVVEQINRGYDLVAFNYYCSYRDDDSELITHENGSFELADDSARNDFFFGKLLLSKIGWSAWDRLFKRSIIETNGIRFADNKKIFLEDLFFSCCYCAHTKSIISIENRMYHYRQREDSIMGVNTSKINFNRINELTKELYTYYSNHDSCDSLIDIFPQIYYYILFNYFLSLRKYYSTFELRNLMMNDVIDSDFLITQLKKIKKQHYISANAYSKRSFYEMKSNSKFFLDNNRITYQFRNKLIAFL